MVPKGERGAKNNKMSHFVSMRIWELRAIKVKQTEQFFFCCDKGMEICFH
jgi:hypothetical protein